MLGIEWKGWYAVRPKKPTKQNQKRENLESSKKIPFSPKFDQTKLFTNILPYIIEYSHKKLFATIVEDYLKAPFSIATTLRCRGGRYSFPFPGKLHFTFDRVPYNAEC